MFHQVSSSQRRISKKKNEREREKKKREEEELKKNAHFAYLSQAFLSHAKIGPFHWYLDSTTSNHMCAHQELLSYFKSCTAVPVEVSDGVINYGLSYSTITLLYSFNNHSYNIKIENVFYVPDFKFNLLSVR